MTRFLFFIDSLSTWIGKAFAWLILVLTLGISYEVFVRYALRAPTTWAFDISYITYGAMFLMAGAYTLVRNQHVRADVLYRFWRPRTQAAMDLLLYILFFLPAVAAWMYAGWAYDFFGGATVPFLTSSVLVLSTLLLGTKMESYQKGQVP